jgi:hypothetical protein
MATIYNALQLERRTRMGRDGWDGWASTHEGPGLLRATVGERLATQSGRRRCHLLHMVDIKVIVLSAPECLRLLQFHDQLPRVRKQFTENAPPSIALSFQLSTDRNFAQSTVDVSALTRNSSTRSKTKQSRGTVSSLRVLSRSVLVSEMQDFKRPRFTGNHSSSFVCTRISEGCSSSPVPAPSYR